MEMEALEKGWKGGRAADCGGACAGQIRGTDKAGLFRLLRSVESKTESTVGLTIRVMYLRLQ
jgi:hypothetical protein